MLRARGVRPVGARHSRDRRARVSSRMSDPERASLARNASTSSVPDVADAADVIERVLRRERDYYAVLGVPRGASASECKRAYRAVARILHPDKCRDERATSAMAIVTSAHSTLTTPALRAAYDLYATRVDVGDDGADSFGAWQSKEGAAAMHLPPWLIKAMAIPVLSQLISILALVLALVIGLALAALSLAYLAVHLAFWLACCCGCGGQCWPRYGLGARVHEKRQARFMEMMRDYERATTEAHGRGDEPPHPTVFFAQWNVDHPEPDWIEVCKREAEVERLRGKTSSAAPSYGAA